MLYGLSAPSSMKVFVSLSGLREDDAERLYGGPEHVIADHETDARKLRDEIERVGEK